MLKQDLIRIAQDTDLDYRTRAQALVIVAKIRLEEKKEKARWN